MAHLQCGDIGLMILPEEEDHPSETDGLRAMPKELVKLLSGLSGEINYLVIESIQLAALLLERRPPVSGLMKRMALPIGNFDFDYLFSISRGHTASLTAAQIVEEITKCGGISPQGKLPDRMYKSVSVLKITRS